MMHLGYFGQTVEKHGVRVSLTCDQAPLPLPLNFSEGKGEPDRRLLRLATSSDCLL